MSSPFPLPVICTVSRNTQHNWQSTLMTYSPFHLKKYEPSENEFIHLEAAQTHAESCVLAGGALARASHRHYVTSSGLSAKPASGRPATKIAGR